MIYRPEGVILCIIMAYTTNRSLLSALQRGDEVSWQEFYETYRPLILFCAKGRLTPEESEDLVQLVMMKFFRSGDKFRYDPAKGHLRSFLGTITRNTITDILRRRKAPDTGTPLPEPDVDDFEQHWEEEWEKHIFAQALTELKSRVSARVFQTFDLYVLHSQNAGDVARFLDIDIDRVYKAKLRCIRILQEIVSRLQEEK